MSWQLMQQIISFAPIDWIFTALLLAWILSYYTILSESSFNFPITTLYHTSITGCKVTSNFVTHLKVSLVSGNWCKFQVTFCCNRNQGVDQSIYQEYLKRKGDKNLSVASNHLTLDFSVIFSKSTKFHSSHSTQKIATVKGLKTFCYKQRYVMISRKHLQNTLLPGKVLCSRQTQVASQFCE